MDLWIAPGYIPRVKDHDSKAASVRRLRWPLLLAGVVLGVGVTLATLVVTGVVGEEKAEASRIRLRGVLRDSALPSPCTEVHEFAALSLSGLELVFYQDAAGQLALQTTTGGTAHLVDDGLRCNVDQDYSASVPARDEYWVGVIGGPTGARVVFGPVDAPSDGTLSLDVYRRASFEPGTAPSPESVAPSASPPLPTPSDSETNDAPVVVPDGTYFKTEGSSADLPRRLRVANPAWRGGGMRGFVLTIEGLESFVHFTRNGDKIFLAEFDHPSLLIRLNDPRGEVIGVYTFMN